MSDEHDTLHEPHGSPHPHTNTDGALCHPPRRGMPAETLEAADRVMRRLAARSAQQGGSEHVHAA